MSGRHRKPTQPGINVAKVAFTGAVIGGSGLALSAHAAAATDGEWDRVAHCESGNNWGINTGNGFQGGLQFTSSTWRGAGGGEFAPAANMASREQQIAVAERVLASQGRGAWPVCGTGLSSATQRNVAPKPAPDAAPLDEAAQNGDAPAPLDAPLAPPPDAAPVEDAAMPAPDAPPAPPAPDAPADAALPAPEAPPAPPAPADAVVVNASGPADDLSATEPPAVGQSEVIRQTALAVPTAAPPADPASSQLPGAANQGMTDGTVQGAQHLRSPDNVATPGKSTGYLQNLLTEMQNHDITLNDAILGLNAQPVTAT